MSNEPKRDAEVRLLACIYAHSAPPSYTALTVAQTKVAPSMIRDRDLRRMYVGMGQLAANGKPFSGSALAELVDDQNAVREVLVCSRSERASIQGLPSLMEVLSHEYLPEILNELLRETLKDTDGDPTVRVRTLVEVYEGYARSLPVEGKGTIITIANSLLDRLKATWAGEIEEKPFVPSQWKSLNRALGGGWWSSENVVAARPGVGKTALWEDEAVYQGEQGRGTLVCSFEMSPEEHLMRMAIRYSQVKTTPAQIWSKGFQEAEEIIWALNHISSLPIEFVCGVGERDVGTILFKLANAIARWEHDAEPRLMVVDYIQQMRDSTLDTVEREQIARCNLLLKDFAVNEGLAWLAMAQLNRDSDKESRKPRLSDLRQCGDIEQDTYNVVAIHRQTSEYVPGKHQECEFVVCKARSGTPGGIPMLWDGPLMKYSEASSPWAEPVSPHEPEEESW